LELDKENEYSVGRTLRVGKFSYSDLDELIVLHVKAMAKKVDEMCGDEKYQNLSKEALGTFRRQQTTPNYFQKLALTLSHRGMAHHLHRGQPQARLLQLRHRPHSPRLLLPDVQSQPQDPLRHLARQGHPLRFRAPRQQIPQHAGSEKRFQDSVPEPRCRRREESAADQRPVELLGALLGLGGNVL
jgi:hypothetical protein